MLWYLFCGLLVLSPIFCMALLYFSVRSGERHEARRLEAGTEDPSAPPLETTPSIEAATSGELCATSAALEAQFLLAPGAAIREAEERLRLPLGSVAHSAEGSNAARDGLRLAFEDLIRKIEQTERSHP